MLALSFTRTRTRRRGHPHGTPTVIADPNSFGRVQSGHAGRIDPPEGGLAYVGKRIELELSLALTGSAFAHSDSKWTKGPQAATSSMPVAASHMGTLQLWMAERRRLGRSDGTINNGLQVVREARPSAG